MLMMFLAWLLILPAARGEMREWKSADGASTMVAEYVRSGDGQVTILRQRDRRTFTLSLDKLSEGDREYVAKREAAADSKKESGAVKEADREFAKLLTGNWERAEGHGLEYRFFGERKLRRPKGDGQGYPLVVFLHGKGLSVITPKEPWLAKTFSMEKYYQKRPCFVIAPQNPDQLGWHGETGEKLVMLIRGLMTALPVDPKRIYLTGYSMGGVGTFHLLAQEAELFAAGIPVAGGGDPASVVQFKDTPVWVFHGAKDPLAPVEMSQVMVKALKEAGGDVKYTEIPEGDHKIAPAVYVDEKVHEWLFAQARD